ncbi:RNA polymerase sigma factor [Kordiimonas sp. SCSIO 12610]|uniref:RNA polymerase sigma factor n=1 Tax=Kordiimonas sp. SCSIO 12610 TaxID=2829597 RepID=UPI00210C1C71|nr:sigma-70 family RNA polymerase sigma factor [Kordiimonas sp. SCSIO 12610]UTW54933.1 sigma-70 family RNA polymerase sigma factor [Kordiimonas sp. SCSIO 12610]
MSIEIKKLIDTTVRRERGRLIADLVSRIGQNNIELAEDMVQEAISAALHQWSFSGLPDNPGAWLNRVARNKAYDQIRKTNREILTNQIEDKDTVSDIPSNVLTGDQIQDTELQLFFLCCRQDLNEKERLCLTLNLACGFTAGDIAAALLMSEHAIAKLLSRTKRKLRSNRKATLKSPTIFEMKQGITLVHKAIYLLFSIGYSSTNSHTTIQRELAFEALRLIKLLLANEQTQTPSGHAIAAIICFQSARFEARFDKDGNIILFKDQDQSLWDRSLINEGFAHLSASKNTSALSRYHIEAAIASVHILPTDGSGLNWQLLSNLYKQLNDMTPSPIVRLNRAIVEMMQGNLSEAQQLLETLSNDKQIKNYAPYYLVLGEFCHRCGNNDDAKANFDRALQSGINLSLEQFLKNRISDITIN